MSVECSSYTRYAVFPVLALWITLSPAVAALHEVEVGGVHGLRFSPASLTIQTGDTVTWRNLGGSHNVDADNGDFGSGPASSAAWTYSFTFEQEGSFGYHCDPHLAQGMVGTIVVQAAPGGDPGRLSFSRSSFSAAEGDGTRIVTVERSGGSSGAVSVDYSTSDGSASLGADYEAASGTLDWGDGDASAKGFSVTLVDDLDEEAAETVNLTLSSPGGGASLGSPSSATLRITDDDGATGGAGALSFTSSTFQAPESAAEASIQVTRTGGSAGIVSVQYSTMDGSASEGIDYTEVSGNLEWSDGQEGVHSFSVPLSDDSVPEDDETVNLILTQPAGGASLGANSSATLTVTDNDSASGPCVADDTTLCLNADGRFEVRLEFRTAQTSGLARKIDFGQRDSGLFYFFNPANAEMLVKVINGCPIAGLEGYWVFYAATTNQEFTLTIRDTSTGDVKVYRNMLGEAAPPVQEAPAFTSCP